MDPLDLKGGLWENFKRNTAKCGVGCKYAVLWYDDSASKCFYGFLRLKGIKPYDAANDHLKKGQRKMTATDRKKLERFIELADEDLAMKDVKQRWAYRHTRAATTIPENIILMPSSQSNPMQPSRSSSPGADSSDDYSLQDSNAGVHSPIANIDVAPIFDADTVERSSSTSLSSTLSLSPTPTLSLPLPRSPSPPIHIQSSIAPIPRVATSLSARPLAECNLDREAEADDNGSDKVDVALRLDHNDDTKHDEPSTSDNSLSPPAVRSGSHGSTDSPLSMAASPVAAIAVAQDGEPLGVVDAMAVVDATAELEVEVAAAIPSNNGGAMAMIMLTFPSSPEACIDARIDPLRSPLTLEVMAAAVCSITADSDLNAEAEAARIALTETSILALLERTRILRDALIAKYADMFSSSATDPAHLASADQESDANGDASSPIADNDDEEYKIFYEEITEGSSGSLKRKCSPVDDEPRLPPHIRVASSAIVPVPPAMPISTQPPVAQLLPVAARSPSSPDSDRISFSPHSQPQTQTFMQSVELPQVAITTAAAGSDSPMKYI